MSIEEKYLTESKLDLEGVGNYVSSDGLGYALQSGLSWQSIEDKKLARMWKQASKLMDDIESYLGDYIFEM